MARRNQYPGRCVKCRCSVAAQAGFLVGPPWGAICARCAPEPAANAPDVAPDRGPGEAAVRIEPKGAELSIRAAGWLGDHFERFREIVSEFASFDRDSKTNVAPRAQLLEILRAFKEAGFKTILAPDLHATLQGEIDQAKATSAKASARIEELRARFKEQCLAMRIYQETGAAFLQESPHGVLLADDPGTGKTIQCLASWEDEPRVVIVAPVNALGNWRRELNRWRPELKVQPVTLGNFVKWPEPGEVLVMSYDAMRAAVTWTKVADERGEEHEFAKVAPGDAPPGVRLVADEIHRLVNKTSKRRQAWDAIHAAVLKNLGRGDGLTGSPVVNQEKDLASLLEAVGALEPIFETRKRFMKFARQGDDEYVRLVRRGMLRRTKKEVLKELPPIQWSTITVAIDADVRAELDELLRQLVATVVARKVEDARKENEERTEGDPVDLDEVRAAAEQNVQEAIDLAFDGKIKIPFELISRVKSLLAAAKLPSALEVLNDIEGDPEDVKPGELFGGFTCDDPIVFASSHVHPVESVGARPGWSLIRGGVTADKRTRLIEDFQAGRSRGIALAIKAASEAITLTRSSRMLINDPEWTPAAMDQLVSRIHRMGQQGRVTSADGTELAEENGAHVQVIRLVADHVLDRRIQEILDIKMGIVERVVDAAAVGVEYRAAGVAQEVERVLQTVEIAKPPEPLYGRRRPQGEGERGAAVILAGGDSLPTAFLRSLRANYLRDGGLSDKQWEYAVKCVSGAFVLRPAASDLERWAARGVLQLAADDPDHAAELNGVGFSRNDNEPGHELASRLRARDGNLTDDEWRYAVRLANRYHGQLEPKPFLEDAPGEKIETPFDDFVGGGA